MALSFFFRRPDQPGPSRSEGREHGRAPVVAYSPPLGGDSDMSDMIDVTILLFNASLPSTALTPLEIFASAGTLWGRLTRTAGAPRFRVRTATIDRRKTTHHLPIRLEPTLALADVRRTDLVIVPAIGEDLERGLNANRRVIEWLSRRSRTTAIAGICSGVMMLAEAGLL